MPFSDTLVLIRLLPKVLAHKLCCDREALDVTESFSLMPSWDFGTTCTSPSAWWYLIWWQPLFQATLQRQLHSAIERRIENHTTPDHRGVKPEDSLFPVNFTYSRSSTAPRRKDQEAHPRGGLHMPQFPRQGFMVEEEPHYRTTEGHRGPDIVVTMRLWVVIGVHVTCQQSDLERMQFKKMRKQPRYQPRDHYHWDMVPNISRVFYIV